jgi:hypothetical protein
VARLTRCESNGRQIPSARRCMSLRSGAGETGHAEAVGRPVARAGISRRRCTRRRRHTARGSPTPSRSSGARRAPPRPPWRIIGCTCSLTSPWANPSVSTGPCCVSHGWVQPWIIDAGRMAGWLAGWLAERAEQLPSANPHASQGCRSWTSRASCRERAVSACARDAGAASLSVAAGHVHGR